MPIHQHCATADLNLRLNTSLWHSWRRCNGTYTIDVWFLDQICSYAVFVNKSPTIYCCCILSSRDRLGFYANSHLIFGTVYLRDLTSLSHWQWRTIEFMPIIRRHKQKTITFISWPYRLLHQSPASKSATSRSTLRRRTSSIALWRRSSRAAGSSRGCASWWSPRTRPPTPRSRSCWCGRTAWTAALGSWSTWRRGPRTSPLQSSSLVGFLIYLFTIFYVKNGTPELHPYIVRKFNFWRYYCLSLCD